MLKPSIESNADTEYPMHQVALWEEPKRAMPVAFARGALFRASAKCERKQLNGPIVTTSDVRINYVGQELRTNDEEVLMFLLHQLRGKSTKDPEQLKIHLTRHEMLRQLEWPTSSDYYRELEDSLDRMKQGTLDVHYRGQSGRKHKLSQSILRKLAVDDKEGPNPKWTVWVEPEILKFFGHHDDYYEVTWMERVRLSRPLSKKTHSFLSMLRLREHSQLALSCTDFWKLSGSETATVKSFKVVFKRCLEELVKDGAIGRWAIKGDVLWCTAPGIAEIDPAKAVSISFFMDGEPHMS